MSWLGVDVGGPRKGFDVALIDDSSLLALVRHDLDAVVALAASVRPRVIGIDSPRSCAPPGETSRADERALAGHEVVEVFPTASWTRWLGPRGSESRAAWSRRGLRALGLAGVPA